MRVLRSPTVQVMERQGLGGLHEGEAESDDSAFGHAQGNLDASAVLHVYSSSRIGHVVDDHAARQFTRVRHSFWCRRAFLGLSSLPLLWGTAPASTLFTDAISFHVADSAVSGQGTATASFPIR